MAGINRLTAKQVQGVKKACRLADGGGLYFVMQKSGSRGWSFMKMINGRRPEIGLGAYPSVSLAQARDLRAQCLAAIADGKDPRAVIRQEAGQVTFAQVMTELIEIRRGGWKSNHTLLKWERARDKHAAALSGRGIGTITRDDVLAVMREIWVERHPTAKDVQKYIEATFDLAIVKGHIEGDNPARWKGNLEFLLKDVRYREEHHASMPYPQVPEFARFLQTRIDATYDGGAARLLMFIMLKGCRNSEARLSRWRDIDLERMIWFIPPENDKVERGREVPLTPHDLTVLGEKGAPDAFIFPSPHKSGAAYSVAAPIRILQKRKETENYTVHGFRTTYKTWAQEHSPHPDEVSEEVIGHVVGSRVRRAYARSKLIEPMRDELTRWAAFVGG